MRSGDFVFFADRCRRKATVCGGRNSKKSGCGDLLETFSYEWDNIPAGTRIFRDDGGRSFQVERTLHIVLTMFSCRLEQSRCSDSKVTPVYSEQLLLVCRFCCLTEH